MLVPRAAFSHDREAIPLIRDFIGGPRRCQADPRFRRMTQTLQSAERQPSDRMMDSTARFGSDHGALRSEDEPLLIGTGRFTDDLTVPSQAYGVFVRAPVSHAAIRDIDLAAARAMPGVIGAYGGKDAADDGLGAIPPVAGFPGRGGQPMFSAPLAVRGAQRIRYAR